MAKHPGSLAPFTIHS